MHDDWWWDLLLGGDKIINFLLDFSSLVILSLSELLLLLFKPFFSIGITFVLTISEFCLFLFLSSS